MKAIKQNIVAISCYRDRAFGIPRASFSTELDWLKRCLHSLKEPLASSRRCMILLTNVRKSSSSFLVGLICFLLSIGVRLPLERSSGIILVQTCATGTATADSCNRSSCFAFMKQWLKTIGTPPVQAESRSFTCIQSGVGCRIQRIDTKDKVFY